MKNEVFVSTKLTKKTFCQISHPNYQIVVYYCFNIAIYNYCYILVTFLTISGPSLKIRKLLDANLSIKILNGFKYFISLDSHTSIECNEIFI